MGQMSICVVLIWAYLMAYTASVFLGKVTCSCSNV